MSGERPGLSGVRRAVFRRDRLTAQLAVALVGVLGVTAVVYGIGVASARYKISDVGAWLSATGRGIVVHANGLAGRVDGKANLLTEMRGHRIKVVQVDGVVLLVDEQTGVVSRLDPSQLKIDQSKRFAVGVQVVIGGGVAYTVDPAKGVVQQIDAATLAAVGQPLTLTPPLEAAGIDAKGNLWVPVPQTGQAIPVHSGRQYAPVTVGKAGDRLALTISAGVPVVTNMTDATSTIIRPEGAQKAALPSTIGQAGTRGVKTPPTTDGQIVPILGPAGTLVLLDTGTGAVTSVGLKLARHNFGVPQILGPRVYIPDQTAGALIVYNTATSKFEPKITVTGRPGVLEVFVKDGILWANDPNGETAVSLDQNGSVKRIKKYEPNVPGGPRRPIPTQGPAGGGSGNNPGGGGGGPGGDLPRAPKLPNPKPKPDAPPGPPQSVNASKQDGTVTVTFGGAPRHKIQPTEYVLLNGSGQEWTQAQPGSVIKEGGTYQFTVPGLACGREYTFRVMVRYVDPKTRKLRNGQWGEDTESACAEPGEPSNVTAAGDQGKITLTFQPEGDTTGVKDYVVTTESGDPVSNVSPASIAPNAGNYRFVVSGLNCDQEYSFKIAARLKTSGQVLSESALARPCKAPSTPYAFSGEPENHAATLTWKTSGAYDVTYTVNGPNGSVTTKENSYKATGLANNQTHSFTLTASNGAGSATPKSTTVSLAYKEQVLRNANNNETNTIIRPSPKKDGEAGRIQQGQYIDITMICQVYGQQVTESETGETSNVWNRIRWNGGTAYLSVTLMTGPRAPGGQVYECQD